MYDLFFFFFFFFCKSTLLRAICPSKCPSFRSKCMPLGGIFLSWSVWVGLHSRIIGLVGLHFRRVGLATRMVCLQSIRVGLATRILVGLQSRESR